MKESLCDAILNMDFCICVDDRWGGTDNMVRHGLLKEWIPACAGMTRRAGMTGSGRVQAI